METWRETCKEPTFLSENKREFQFWLNRNGGINPLKKRKKERKEEEEKKKKWRCCFVHMSKETKKQKNKKKTKKKKKKKNYTHRREANTSDAEKQR